MAGRHPQNKVSYKQGYQIVNTSSSKQRGLHWVALYVTARTVYVFDSYGRPSSNLLKTLTRQAKKQNLRIVDSDPDMQQIGYSSETCGHMTLAWLQVVKDLGIRKALLV